MKTTTTASTAGSPRILPFGDRGLLAEVASLDEAVALHAALAASRPRGVVGLVPAARTVLVEIDPDDADTLATIVDDWNRKCIPEADLPESIARIRDVLRDHAGPDR